MKPTVIKCLNGTERPFVPGKIMPWKDMPLWVTGHLETYSSGYVFQKLARRRDKEGYFRDCVWAGGNISHGTLATMEENTMIHTEVDAWFSPP